MFRMFFQGNPFQQATRGLAKGSLVMGLLLIGFGMLVFVLRDLFGNFCIYALPCNPAEL